MFKWTLTDNDTRVVETIRDPEGWEDIQFIHKRSEKWDGIFFDYSQSLAFACGAGKELIDLAYDNKGSEADVSLEIVYSCDGVEKSFDSQLNFASYSIQFKGNELHTIIDVEKTGISQIIQNRSGTDIDLLSDTSLGGVELNDYTFLELAMHSKVIQFKSQWDSETHGCCFRLIDVNSANRFQLFSLFPPFTSLSADFIKTITQRTQCSIIDTRDNQYANFESFLSGAPSIVDTTTADSLTQQGTATLVWDITGTIKIETFEVTPDESANDCSGCIDGCGDSAGDSACGSLPLENHDIDRIDMSLRLFWGSSLECAMLNVTWIDIADMVSMVPFGGPSDIANFSDFSGLSGTLDIPIIPDDKIWCYWVGQYEIGSPTDSMDLKFTVNYDTANLSITMPTISTETTAKTLPIHESWSRICEGITDQTLAFKSEFFGRTNSQGLSYPDNGYGSFTGITDGRRIRGIEQVTDGSEDVEEGTTKKGIITNLDDMFDSCNTIWGVGLGVETENGIEVVRVEEKDYFFDDTILLTFDSVANMEMVFLEDKAFSGIDLGFRRWKTEFINGLDSIMTNASWVFTKIKSFDNIIDFSSPYIASMYAIETTRRRNVIFSTSNDTKYDDDIFIIALKREIDDMAKAERNENITVISDLIDPDTAYNLRFNLFSCLDRVLNQITNGLTKDAPQPINFTDFEGNGSMKFQFNDGHAGDLNGVASENVQNTFYRSTDHRRIDPIVLPEKYTFTQPVPFKDYVTICDNPRGKIRFSSNGVDFFEGWIDDLEYSLKTSLGNFTIIRKFE